MTSTMIQTRRPVAAAPRPLRLAEPFEAYAETESTPARPAVRLTRRGRIVLGALLVLVVLMIFSLGRVSAGANPAAGSASVTVQAGDTLWGIAQRVAPGADPRDMVARLQQLNHLSGSAALAPGEVLAVPTR